MWVSGSWEAIEQKHTILQIRGLSPGTCPSAVRIEADPCPYTLHCPEPTALCHSVRRSCVCIFPTGKFICKIKQRACPVMEPALGPGAWLWEAGRGVGLHGLAAPPPTSALTGLGALPPETAFHTGKRPRFVRVFAKLHKDISLLQTEQFFKKAENFSACIQQGGEATVTVPGASLAASAARSPVSPPTSAPGPLPAPGSGARLPGERGIGAPSTAAPGADVALTC